MSVHGTNLNFGVPYTFLVLLDTFENIRQFFDNSKIFLSFRSKFQKNQTFEKIQKSRIFEIFENSNFLKNSNIQKYWAWRY